MVSWFDWKLVQRRGEMRRFCQALIAMRRRQPTIRRARFLTGWPAVPGELADVSWFSSDGTPVDWDRADHSLVCLLGTAGLEDEAAREVLIFFHSGPQPQPFVLPEASARLRWQLFVDTAATAPEHIYPAGDGPDPAATVRLDHHSLQCYIAAGKSRPARRPGRRRRS